MRYILELERNQALLLSGIFAKFCNDVLNEKIELEDAYQTDSEELAIEMRKLVVSLIANL